MIVDKRSNYAEKFFEKPVGSSEAVQRIVDLLKKENDKTGFINSLSENTGLPVWDKLVAEKQKANDAARGIIIDKESNYLIPLSNDNKTLSALLCAMKKDGKYEFYCYDNNYAYGIAFSNDCNIKDKEKVMGLFMGMSNYVFGLGKFKNLPKGIFEGFESKAEENGDPKKVFFKTCRRSLPDIFINDVFVPVTYRKCYWEFRGTCNCNGSNNTPENCDHPNSECPTGTCTKEVCYTFIELGNGPGTNPPTSTPNNGTGVPPTTNSNSNWSNNFGSPLPGSDPTNLPNAPCNNNCSWFAEAPEYEFEQEIDLTNPESEVSPVPPIIWSFTGDDGSVCVDKNPLEEPDFQFDPSDNYETSYPRFTNLVKNLKTFVKNNPRVLNALQRYSGFTKQQIIDHLSYGQGPTIKIEEMNFKVGFYKKSAGINTLHIRASYVRGLEQAFLESTKQATAFLLAVTILHEFVHLGTTQNNISEGVYDFGSGFERDAFNVIVNDDNAGTVSIRFSEYF